MRPRRRRPGRQTREGKSGSVKRVGAGLPRSLTAVQRVKRSAAAQQDGSGLRHPEHAVTARLWRVREEKRSSSETTDRKVRAVTECSEKRATRLTSRVSDRSAQAEVLPPHGPPVRHLQAQHPHASLSGTQPHCTQPRRVDVMWLPGYVATLGTLAARENEPRRCKCDMGCGSAPGTYTVNTLAWAALSMCVGCVR